MTLNEAAAIPTPTTTPTEQRTIEDFIEQLRTTDFADYPGEAWYAEAWAIARRYLETGSVVP